MTKPIKPRWLNKDLIQSQLWYTLVTSEAMYYAECKRCDIPIAKQGLWINDGADATCSEFMVNKRRCFIVSIRIVADQPGINVAALLVHEAVHLWQHFCESIGETNPSNEFEAYSIQRISQQLMYEYQRQLQL